MSARRRPKKSAAKRSPPPLPADCRDMMATAMAVHRGGDPAQALAIYERIAERAPGHPDVQHLSAAALLGVGRAAQARDHIEAALQTVSKLPAYHQTHAEVLIALGETSLARDSLRRAVKLDDRFAPAWNGLAALARAEGDMEAAADALKKVVALSPDSPEAHNDLGMAYQAVARWRRAIKCFRKAVALAPTFSRAWSNLAGALQQSGDSTGAADALVHVLDDSASAARAQFNLSCIAADEDRWLDALNAIQRAIECDPGDAKCYLQLAVIARALDDDAQAEGALGSAIAIDPELAVARNDLGVMQLARGDHEGAEQQFLAAIRCRASDPSESTQARALAYENLVRCRRFHAADQPLLTAIESELACAPTVSGVSASLCFAAARMHDDMGHHDQAWRHWRQANGLERTRLPRHDAQTYSQYVDRIIACVDEAFLLGWREQGVGDATQHPIFVLGLPGPGRARLGFALAHHPQLEEAADHPYFERLSAVMPERVGRTDIAYPECLDHLNEQDFAGIAAAYRSASAGQRAGDSRVLDMTLANLEHVGLIALSLPSARFVHCFETLTTSAIHTFAAHLSDHYSFACSLEDIEAWHADSLRLIDHWRALLKPQLLEIDGAEVLAQPHAVANSLCAFLDLSREGVVYGAFDPDTACRSPRASGVPLDVGPYRALYQAARET